MARGAILLTVLSTGSAFFFSQAPLTRVGVSHLQQSHIRAVMQEEEVKVAVRVKKPSEAKVVEPASDVDTSATTSVTIKKRPKSSESQAADEAPEASAGSTSVTIKKKEKAPVGNATEGAESSAEPEPPTLEQQLVDGVMQADVKGVVELLEKGANVKGTDAAGRTPLHLVAAVGNAPGVLILVHYGADVNVQDKGGLTPLHMAAGYTRPQTVKTLIECGADPNIKGDDDMNPFDLVDRAWAAEKQKAEAKTGVMNRLNRKKEQKKFDDLIEIRQNLENAEQVREEADLDSLLGEVLGFLMEDDDETEAADGAALPSTKD